MVCLGDMASFVFHDGKRVGFFFTKQTMVLKSIANGIGLEPRAKRVYSVNYLTSLGSRLDRFAESGID